MTDEGLQAVEISSTDPLYQAALRLRHELFFAAHGMPASVVQDAVESQSVHMAIADAGELIAYGRLTEVEPQSYQVSQMVVSPQYQSQGYGSRLLSSLVCHALRQGAREVFLNARLTATALYRKQGFLPQGEAFVSPRTGVEHIRMLYSGDPESI